MNWLKHIWEFDRWVIKLALLITFVFLTGFPQFMAKHISEEQKKRPFDERAIRARQIDPMMMERVKEVERQVAAGRAYSPDEYFEDLKRYKEKCYELRISEGGSAEINRLGWLMQKGVSEKKFTNWDISRAAKAYHYWEETGGKFRKEFVRDTRSVSWGEIFFWFLRLYLKLLPLVFILFMVWAKDEAGYKKFRLPRPLRFFVLLALYPFVIGYYVWRAMREDKRRIAAEAELRRTKRLFQYVTEEEQKKIEQFAKSNLSLAEWRSTLAEMGLKPRHSFAAALAVTLLFVVAVRPVEACAKHAKDLAGNVTLEQITTSQNLARMGIDDTKKIQPEKSSWTWEGTGADLALESARGLSPVGDC